SAGTTLQHALTTGFANDDLFLKYNYGKNQFSVDYTLNYRNYMNMKQETFYSYLFDDKTEKRSEKTANRFGYDNHYINLKYLHQVPESQVFQFRVSPNFSQRHSEDYSLIDLNGQERQGVKTDKSRIVNPFLNAYYWKQFSNRQELTVDVVGTLFSTKQDKLNQEFSDGNRLKLEDKMNLDNRKQSLIGELIYDKKIGLDKWSFGYKIETYRLFSKVENSFDNRDYTSSYLSNYAYGEFSGIKNNFLYRISLGMINRSSQSYDARYSAWLFKPILVGGYRIDDKHTVRLLYTQSPEEPELSDLSNNRIYVTDNILKKGNPELKYGFTKGAALMYSYNQKAVDFSLIALCGETEHPINSYFLRTEEYIVQTTVNDRDSREYGIRYSMSVKPFSNDWLTLKLSGEATKTVTNSLYYGKLSRLYAPFQYAITIKYNAYVMSYQGNIVDKKLSGAFLVADENKSHVTVQYTKRNFSISGNLFWAFTRSEYSTETTPESMVQYGNYRQIDDNANMFTLGLSYTFNSGTKYSAQDKKINNRDVDSGLFK
ncbi:MAG: outer membrane beta-barrel protein, partial [Dysgonamonadaceae bacterium]|nr:outer membrane beta-barrel protein [Dysgonamonadaceae bacterium]